MPDFLVTYHNPFRRSGFTFVEILIVLAIIAILAGLILTGLNALNKSSGKARTGTIIETVRQALESFSAEQAGFIQQVEHPLAGSYGTAAAPRMLFRRSVANGGNLLSGDKGQNSVALRSALSSATQSIFVSPATTECDRLLLDDDYYADPKVPLLYGVQRQYLGILGAAVANVVKYRRLPSTATAVTNPDDTSLYPDLTCLVTSSDLPSASKNLLDHVFGASGVTSTLSKLKGLQTVDETTGAAICYGRVWSSIGTGVSTLKEGETSWKLGYMIDPEIPKYTMAPNTGKDRWVPYATRGLHIIDAWGTEILYSVPAVGGIPRLISAGPDGVFTWHPGEDSSFQTAANATSPAGDDKDGSKDNIQIAAGVE